jgi:hypothetical protein
MQELTFEQVEVVSGGKKLEEKDVIREEGILFDTCYFKKEDGSKGPRVKCPKKE